MKDFRRIWTIAMHIETITQEQYWIESETLDGETKLWRAVIFQALEDLNLPPTNIRYRRWRKQATQWFLELEEEFEMVCELAKFPPECILTIAYERISKQV
jgi:hypothetical protein